MTDLRHIDAGVLKSAYLQIGPEDGPPVILLHGFPYDIHAYDAVSKRLAGEGRCCIVPFLRGYGPTRFLAEETPRSGQQGALAADLLALMDALNIERAVLAGYDWGGRAACIVSALWPERVTGLVSGGVGYNIQNIARSRVPESAEQENRLWYIHCLNNERGRALIEKDRYGLCRLLWKLWSPTWHFDDTTFQRTALSFDNPDFTEVVLHSYRHRWANAMGDPDYDGIEELLAGQPDIAVSTIVLEGTDDGVDPPPEHDRARDRFVGPYQRRLVEGAGHNIPQEAPDAFSDAVVAATITG